MIRFTIANTNSLKASLKNIAENVLNSLHSNLNIIQKKINWLKVVRFIKVRSSY